MSTRDVNKEIFAEYIQTLQDSNDSWGVTRCLHFMNHYDKIKKLLEDK